MKHILLITILLLSFVSTAQKKRKKTHYYDANLNEISASKFKRRQKSNLFKTLVFENDTAKVKKLVYLEVFGKLDQKKHHQLKKLYSLRHKIDTTKSWFIHYVDSIPDEKKMPKHSGNAYYTKNGKYLGFIAVGQDESKFREMDKKAYSHRHLKNYDDYVKKIIREENVFQRSDNAELLHFYAKNYGFSKDFLIKHKYIKDYNLIVKNFFKEAIKQYKVIIIHPNGEFHLSFYETFYYTKEDPEPPKHKLLEKEYFNKIRNLWKRKIKKYN